jgi:hypothetical protein
MIVQVKQAPGYNELIQTLKSQFSNYSVYTFDSKPQRSIIVRKSATVGAQITVSENEIMVDACYPNIFISSLMSLLTASTIFPFNAWPNIEKEVSDFLKRRYTRQALLEQLN